ncbi:MAG: hypothetical protein ACPG4Z_07630, partial [Chitinophagales bacterium]
MISLSDINCDIFSEKALEVFHFQAKNNLVYAQYLEHLKIDITTIDSIEKIPFLPIELFKTQKVISTEKPCTHFF